MHIISLIFGSVISLVTLASAQVPQMINYQGRVAVGDPAVNFDGTGEFRFALVNANGSTSYWSNDGTSTEGSEPTAAVSLTVTKGLYSVLLGANMTAITPSVFTNADVRLRVWFDDGSNGSQLLTPDQRIAAVGYAMVASSLQPGVDIIAGTVTATSFIGDGSGLTNIPASAIVPADPPSSPAGMVLIPAGDFAMGRQSGSGYGDELPVHTVTVSAFYLDKYEVSKALWDEVKAYADGFGYTFSNSGSGVGVNHPVNRVNWYDCVKWCNARSEKEGLAPVYYTDAGFTTVYKTGEGAAPFANWAVNGFRLPTEAEWEKAARGTTANTYPWGNSIGGEDANYFGSGDPFDEGTTPVGYYDGGQEPAGLNRANGYGLYDMAGNVWEWCWDWYDGNWYDNTGATTPDTRGPNPASGARVLRGGSWFSSTIDLRCANRVSVDPVGVISINGFRSARGL